jgi:uncharacterized protein
MVSSRPFAIVTGASTGIGYELARQCAANGHDLLIVADEPEIQESAQTLRAMGIDVQAVQADLSEVEGVDKVYEEIASRPVDVLVANAGRGLGHAFLDQNFDDALKVINTNITGTLYLIYRVGNDMRTRGKGKILITGSVAGFIPGTFQAVYNSSKAFLDSFSFALREELKGSGIGVTCLMPGATETEFFARAGMLDTKVGVMEKMNPAEVAMLGYQALMNGDGQVIAGWANKLRVVAAHILPSETLAEQNREHAEPGTAERYRADKHLSEQDEPEQATAEPREGERVLVERSPEHVEPGTAEKYKEESDRTLRVS